MKNKDKSKIFRERDLQLTAEEVVEMARLMEAMPDPASALEEQDLQVEQKINQDLKAKYGSVALDKIPQKDPTSLSDDELWQRIQAAMPASLLPKAPTKAAGSNWKIWSAVLASAAALLLFVRPWESAPEPQQRFKGNTFGEEQFRQQGCQLALRVKAQTIELGEGASLPAGGAALLQARCQRSGYLHVLFEASGQRVSFANIPVSQPNQWLDLEDQQHNPLGLMLPETGILNLAFGLSEAALDPEQLQNLGAETVPQKLSGWLWIKQGSWPVVTGER